MVITLILRQSILTSFCHGKFFRRAVVWALLAVLLSAIPVSADEIPQPSASGIKGQAKQQVEKVKIWTEPIWRRTAPLYDKAVTNIARCIRFVTSWAQKHFPKAFAGVGKLWGQQLKAVQKTDAGKKIANKISLASDAVREAAQRVNVAPVRQSQVVIRLKNGSSIGCEIVWEDEDRVVVLWEGGQITFARDEIAGIDRQRQAVEGDGITITEPVSEGD